MGRPKENERLRRKELFSQGLKQCSKCPNIKEVTEFSFSKKSTDGLVSSCKKCHAEYHQQYLKNQKENNLTELRKRQKTNREKYRSNPEKLKKERQSTIDKYNSDEEYRKTYLEKQRKRNKTPKARARARKYESNKKKTDINYKLAKILRDRTKTIVRKIKRNNKDFAKCAGTLDLLGCTIEFFKKHIESQFDEYMAWENHGFGDCKWHVDHIKPCDSFDLTNPEEQRICFHYTNLRPLWQHDNLSKSNKF